MENNVKIFENSEFGQLEVLTIGDKCYFPATECAKVLGYKEPEKAVRAHCRGVSKMDTPTKSGVQSVGFIPEGDLYRLIVRSKLPSAQRFESWVFDTVLPQIRKTGGYIPVKQEDTDFDIMVKAAAIMQKTIADKDEFIKDAMPKLETYNVFLNAEGLYNFNTWASALNCGQYKLMEFLRKNKVIQKGERGVTWNQPYRRFLKAGYFKVKFVIGHDGVAYPTTYITPIGAEYVMKFCKKHGFSVDENVA